MSTTPIRMGLIGLGNQGKEQLATCLRMPDAIDVQLVVDQQLTSLPTNLTSKCTLSSSLETFTSLGIEAAIVAIPPYAYAGVLPFLIKNRIHTLIEKPLGMDLHEASGFLDQARLHRTHLLLAAQRRFHPPYNRVADLLKQNKMGRITQATFGLEIKHLPNSWRKDFKIGSLIDLGFHALDLMRDFFGDLHLLSANLFDRNQKPCRDRHDASAHLMFLTESGTHLRLHICDGASEKKEYFHAISDTHRLHVTRAGFAMYLLGDNTPVLQETFSESWDQAMEAQILHFVNQVRSNEAAPSNLSASFGLVTMKLLEEIYAKSIFA